MMGLKYKRHWGRWFIRLAVLIIPGLLFLLLRAMSNGLEWCCTRMERGIERVADKLPDAFELVEVDTAPAEEDKTWEHGV